MGVHYLLVGNRNDNISEKDKNMVDSLIFFLNCTVTLFSIIDPLGGAAVLLAMTDGDTPTNRSNQARRAVMATGSVLIFFTILGGAIFALFGISIYALMVAGGLILLRFAFKMVEGESFQYKSSKPELAEAEIKEDIAIIPLAVPLMAGPAAITTVMVFANRANGVLEWILLFMAIGITLYLTHIILQQSQNFSDWLGDLGTRILTRAMGLVLLAMGAEFILSGIKGYFE